MKSNDISSEIYRAAPYTWLLLAELIFVNAFLYAQFRMNGLGETISFVFTSFLLVLGLGIPYLIASQVSQYKRRLSLTHRYILPALMLLFLAMFDGGSGSLKFAAVFAALVYYLTLVISSYRFRMIGVEISQPSSKPEYNDFKIPTTRYILNQANLVLEDTSGKLSLIGVYEQIV